MKVANQPNTCQKIVTHKLTIRIVNCHAIFLLIVANIIRLAHFRSVTTLKSKTNDDGTTSIE